MANHSILTLALPLALSVACAQSQGEKVRDARMEQVDAQTQANLAAVDQKYRAGGEVVQQQYNEEKHAISQAKPPAEGATEELATISKERTDYQNHAQVRLEKVQVRFEAAKQKLDILGPRAPSNLQTMLQTVQTEHHTILQDVVKLGSVSPDSWGSSKSSIEERLSDLEGRVTKLNGAIEDV
ncbi:MAG: hypothetical protein JWN04_720 [Myxococcaceae bacterium]|nr:hypothetical protein [Myxococcaceae bacterium]